MDIIGICISAISILVAVGIACWTSRSSAKDTAKQIAALKESTNRQVESIKRIEKIQIDLSILQLEMDIMDARQNKIKIMKKETDAIGQGCDMLGMPYNEMVSKIHDNKEKKNALSYEREYWDKHIKTLNSNLELLKQLRQEIYLG